jgi:hypothetical protein
MATAVLPESLDENSAAVVKAWLRAVDTADELKQLWGELSAYSQNLEGVVALKDELKEEFNAQG